MDEIKPAKDYEQSIEIVLDTEDKPMDVARLAKIFHVLAEGLSSLPNQTEVLNVNPCCCHRHRPAFGFANGKIYISKPKLKQKVS